MKMKNENEKTENEKTTEKLTQVGVRKTTEQEREVLEYLNTLRESGATNMFGATPYIIEEFQIGSIESRRLLSLWMNNFNENGNYNEVNI